jgi:hypothetical protein
MDEELNRLLDNLQPVANSLKSVVDDYVNKLVGYREASLRAEEAFQARKAALDASIGGLRSQVDQLKQELIDTRRAIKIGRDELDRVRREIAAEKQAWLDRIAEIQATKLVA